MLHRSVGGLLVVMMMLVRLESTSLPLRMAARVWNGT